MSNTASELAVVEAELVHTATREEAEQRRGLIRTALEFAVDGLVEAYRHRDYEALGYGTGAAGWEAYLADSYGDLRFALPAPAREERVVVLAEGGLTSARALGAIPGMGGKSTAARDLARLREAGRLSAPTATRGLDGRTRKAPARPDAPAPAHLSTVDAIVAAAEALESKGADGVTTLDLMGRLKWRQGPASAAQSRAVKRGRLEWAGTWREGFAVYRVARPALG